MTQGENWQLQMVTNPDVEGSLNFFNCVVDPQMFTLLLTNFLS